MVCARRRPEADRAAMYSYAGRYPREAKLSECGGPQQPSQDGQTGCWGKCPKLGKGEQKKKKKKKLEERYNKIIGYGCFCARPR